MAHALRSGKRLVAFSSGLKSASYGQRMHAGSAHDGAGSGRLPAAHHEVENGHHAGQLHLPAAQPGGARAVQPHRVRQQPGQAGGPAGAHAVVHQVCWCANQPTDLALLLMHVLQRGLSA